MAKAKSTQLIAAAAKSSASQEKTFAEKPLSTDEVTELKRHFRFLREHKKELKLKLNANEDLLLNGAKPPEHRGVCHHLLAKVDYTQVAAAVERLEPTERPRFIEGVLGFASELSFLLLYLESLKDAGRRDASSALVQALRRMNFENVSEGQMKRTLALIVELFAPEARPNLLLGLLESRSFRAAFEQSLKNLPAELSALVAPLRVVHSAILKGKPEPEHNDELIQGVKLILQAGPASFEKRPVAVRRRLLQTALKGVDTIETGVHESIDHLLLSLKDQAHEDEYVELALQHAAALLRAEQYTQAERSLEKLCRLKSKPRAPEQWLKASKGERFGDFALLKTKRRNESLVHALRPAFCLRNQTEGWLRLGEPSDKERFSEHARLLEQAQLPLVVPLQTSGVTESGHPYHAMTRAGQRAPQAFRSREGPSPEACVDIAGQCARLLRSLGLAGIRLPDAALWRFEIRYAQATDSDRKLRSPGQLWLVDLWEAEVVETQAALAANLTAARQFAGMIVRESEHAQLNGARTDALDANDLLSLIAALRQLELLL